VGEKGTCERWFGEEWWGCRDNDDDDEHRRCSDSTRIREGQQRRHWEGWQGKQRKWKRERKRRRKGGSVSGDQYLNGKLAKDKGELPFCPCTFTTEI
jgi:hypothetical protein